MSGTCAKLGRYLQYILLLSIQLCLITSADSSLTNPFNMSMYSSKLILTVEYFLLMNEFHCSKLPPDTCKDAHIKEPMMVAILPRICWSSWDLSRIISLISCWHTFTSLSLPCFREGMKFSYNTSGKILRARLIQFNARDLILTLACLSDSVSPGFPLRR